MSGVRFQVSGFRDQISVVRFQGSVVSGETSGAASYLTHALTHRDDAYYLATLQLPGRDYGGHKIETLQLLGLQPFL